MKPEYAYHVTTECRIKSIMNHGLIPHVPEDYGTSGDTKAVYLFPSLDDVNNALSNWLGIRMEEQEEEQDRILHELVLIVDITNIETIENENFSEILVFDRIPPELIHIKMTGKT